MQRAFPPRTVVHGKLTRYSGVFSESAPAVWLGFSAGPAWLAARNILLCTGTADKWLAGRQQNRFQFTRLVFVLYWHGTPTASILYKTMCRGITATVGEGGNSHFFRGFIIDIFVTLWILSCGASFSDTDKGADTTKLVFGVVLFIFMRLGALKCNCNCLRKATKIGEKAHQLHIPVSASE